MRVTLLSSLLAVIILGLIQSGSQAQQNTIFSLKPRKRTIHVRYPLFTRLLLTVILCLVQNVTSAQQSSVFTLTWTCADGLTVPMVRATLSDGKPRLFIVNTSVTITAIDRDVAHEVGLMPPPGDAKLRNFVKSPLHLGPGTFTLDNVPFRLVDLSLVRQDDPNIAGILGMNVLSHYTFRMDYAKQQMDVMIGNVPALPNLPKDVTRIPLIRSGDTYSVEANIDGHPTQFVINTGADQSSMRSPDLLKSLKPRKTLDGFHAAAASASGDGLSSIDTRLLRLHKLRLSGLTWDNPVLEQQIVPSKDTSNTLGNDFLKRFHVVLDFPASMLYLTPDPAFKEDPNAWVGIGIALGIDTANGKVIIAGVYGPSPAKAAGLGEGDEIVSFDGHPLKGLTSEEVDKLFGTKKKLGDTLTLEVMHPNQSTTRSVKLELKSLL